MSRAKSKAVKIIIGLAAIILAILGISRYEASRHKLDGFAQCLKDQGAIFYGTFWCPHCQEQKSLFQGSASLLPYVECSTPDGQGQTVVCQDQKITSYPTWQFADGYRVTGAQSLEILASTTSCALPNN